MDENKTHIVTEDCPHCGRKIEMHWETRERGFQGFCPVCGGKLLLCNACTNDKSCKRDCNYNGETKRCWRCPQEHTGQGSRYPQWPSWMTEEYLAALNKSVKSTSPKEIMEHFGYKEDDDCDWISTWLNMPSQIERLAALPDFITTLGLQHRYRITFDYDPEYPNMLLRIKATDHNERCLLLRSHHVNQAST